MYDFYRVAAIVPELRVADPAFNTDKIIEKLEEAYAYRPAVIAFPELAISGYTCQDLFFQETLLREVRENLSRIMKYTSGKESAVLVGAPFLAAGQLYNGAFVFFDGKLLGITVKTFLPNYHEFYEKRWFEPADKLPVKDLYLSELGLSYEDESGREEEDFWEDKEGTNETEIEDYSVPVGSHLIYDLDGKLRFGVEICEDLWAPIPPSSVMAMAGAELIVNLSASNELIAKREYRKNLVRQTSANLLAEYLYCSAGSSESTQDVIFSGHSILCENGAVLNENQDYIASDYILIADMDLGKIRSERARMKSFADAAAYYRDMTGKCRVITEVAEKLPESDATYYILQKQPFVPSSKTRLTKRCEDIFDMQVGGLVKRLSVTGACPVVGVSGGMDSTLALLVSAMALRKMGRPAEQLVAITMPAFGTSDRTYQNSLMLIKSLGAIPIIVDIRQSCEQHLRDLKHDLVTKDITYENTQARERTQVLMDYANMHNGLVVGTGDLSELALGWCTYNGDQMSMYGVNGSIPKTLVRWMIHTVAEGMLFPDSTVVLRDILDTPISPELLPPDEHGRITQKTEESVGPYELHDFFLYYMMRYGYSPKKVFFLAEKAFKNDYTVEELLKWLAFFYKRFFGQQFKRSCMPDGVKVGSVSLSPRGDWRMPSDAAAARWLAEVEELKKTI